MKKTFFFAIFLWVILVFFHPAFAEDISECYEQDEDILQADELPPAPSEATISAIEMKDAAKTTKKSEKNSHEMAKEEAKLRDQEEADAKKADRAKFEEEFERRRLADAERREELYKKIENIEKNRDAEYWQKKGGGEKAPVPADQNYFEVIPDDVNELIKAADEYYNNGDYDKAREYYDKARFLAEEKKKK